MESLYQRIDMLCTEHGISGYKLCKTVGMSPGQLTDLKMGRQATLSAVNVNKIANYFGVSVDYLLTGESEPEEPEQVMSDEELTIVNLYKIASPEMRAAAMAILKAAEEMQQMKAQLGDEAESVAKEVTEKAAEKFGK